MRDVLEKMRECGKDVKMRDFPHDCGMVDTYGSSVAFRSLLLTKVSSFSSCFFPFMCVERTSARSIDWLFGIARQA